MQEALTDQIRKVKTLEMSMIRALAYSEVFSYPLKMEELKLGMDVLCEDENKLFAGLEELKTKNIVFEQEGFYSLSENMDLNNDRYKKNARAKKYLRYAKTISAFIGSFPFVRGVFISGSLTKNSMDVDGDIDYFIITEPKRLWLTRTLLIGFKKIFLFNSYKLFCLNYFLDKNNLEIEDRNLYLAHEIATLIPTYGFQYCKEFMDSNQWIDTYLPNAEKRELGQVKQHRIRGFKYLAEKMLDGRMGRFLDTKFRAISESYWSKKFKKGKDKSQRDYFISKEEISALHPDNFKLSVLKRYQEILKVQEEKLNIQVN